MKKCLSMLCALALLVGMIPAAMAAGDGFLKQSGHLNSAYIEWRPVAGATGYQVFVKRASAADTTYQRLDDELVRQYPDYWRADAMGLAAGSYVMKVVPVKNGAAMAALVTGTLEVRSHERTGYAFFGGSVPGAYKMDGTLKDKAQVIYVTEANKNSVKLGSYTGLQNIVTNINKIGTPVDIRIVGRVTGISNSLLLIKGSTAQLTIEGVGNDAAADGWGFEINTTENMELSNLAIMMVASAEGDGVTLNKAKHTWVHNCDFFYNTARNDDGEGDKEKGDGSLDTKHSTYITHSYNHFWDAGKCNLQGSNTSDTSDWITYHHNWYDHSDSRHPRVRVAHVHVYNNYYDNNDGYGIGAVFHATVFSDRNYFDYCKEPMLIAYQGSDSGHFTGNGGTGEDGGMIKAYGNIVVGGTYVPYSKNNTAFDAYDVADITDTVPSSVKSKRGDWGYDNFDTDAKKFYTYAADAAADVPAKVRSYAGRVEGGDLKYDMTTLQNAGSKYPDAGLLAVLQTYTGTLVSVGGGDSTITDPGTTEPEPSHQHRWGDWVETTKATCTAPGVKTQTCLAADCPEGSQTQAIPALGHDYVNNVCSRCGTKLVGKTYTLTGNEVFAELEKNPGKLTFGADSKNPNSYVASNSGVTSATGGTEDFFTLLYAQNSRVDPSAKTFDDGFEGAHRINFQGAASTTANTIRFTTDGPAKVKVWWVGAVAANEITSSKQPRPMVVLNSAGKEVALSETVADNTTPKITTFDLAEAGTYYLGAKGGKNFIFRVDVIVGTEEAPPEPDALDWGALTGPDDRTLDWRYTRDDRVVITGTLNGDEKVLVGCYDARNRLTGVKLLTRSELEAQLAADIPTIKLFWLDGSQEPLCEAVTVEK